MSDATQKDREAVKAFHHAAAAHMLAAIKDKSFADALGENNESHPIYQAFAEHRIAAEKAVLDRLREPTHEMVRRLNAACDVPDVNMAWVFPFIASALADALETKR